MKRRATAPRLLQQRIAPLGSARALTRTTLAAAAMVLILGLWAAGAAAAAMPLPAAPLGLIDITALLDQADQTIAAAPSPGGLTSASATQALSCLEQSRRYCERLANGSIGQIPYRWVRIGSKRAEPSPGKRLFYIPAEPVSAAGAARLDSRGGDIFVKEMVVVRKDGSRQPYPMGRWISSDLPKRHVAYFTEPADVASVEVTMYRKWTESARLVVELGIPAPPDYAREIAGLCVRARTALKRNDLTACRAALDKARQRLEAFRKAQER